MSSKFLTLATHRSDCVEHISSLLKTHDIEFELHELDIVDSTGAALIEIRVPEESLLKSVELMESGIGYTTQRVVVGNDAATILIPVDLSDSSILACRIGFALAVRLGIHPVLLHTYTPTSNVLTSTPSMLDDFDYSSAETEEFVEEKNIQIASLLQMARFCRRVRRMQSEGTMPNVSFSRDVVPGVPEDAIKSYVKQTPPRMIVMATRGTHKRREELIGSITVEVIDSCRVPVFTVPENINFESIEAIKKLVCFCSLDKNDFSLIHTLMNMFDSPEVDICLVPIIEKRQPGIENKVKSLVEYFSHEYPLASFSYKIFNSESYREEMEHFLIEEDIQMLLVPNKKQSILKRLFNPGIAHRILFEKDLPMFAIPV